MIILKHQFLRELKFCLCIIVQLLVAIPVFSQGKLVLIGGGSETEGGWSDAPYKWGIDQSANKKVAIISSTSADNFLPNYFKSLGADDARNFQIDSRVLANSTVLYNDLKQYDVLFFKGGDQNSYYTNFKDTKIEQAITELYLKGGVLMGTSAGAMILSGINSLETVYPYETLKDYNNFYVNLSDDFTEILPNFIVDTHFLERGRFGRMVGFMANRFLNHQQYISGLGVDDQTAFCIDQNRLATVFGTGAVTVFPSTSFEKQGKMASSPDFEIMSLLEGDQIDLTTFEVAGLATPVIPATTEENRQQEIWLAGGHELADNTGFLGELATEHITKKMVLITADTPELAISYQQALEERGVLAPVVLQITEPLAEGFADSITEAELIFLIGLENTSFMAFLNGAENGAVLKQKIADQSTVVVATGENSALAGPYYCTNVTTNRNAAYNGNLIFDQALGLFQTVAISSNVYSSGDNRDFFENRTAAVHHMMVAYKLRRGLWLSPGNYVVFRPTATEAGITANGNLSVLLLTNNGTNAELISRPPARNGAGFESMAFKVLQNQQTYDLNAESLPIAAPIPNFQVEPPLPLTAEIEVAFSNSSQNATSFVWAFPNENTSTNENATFTFPAAGNYLVSLTAKNGTVGRTYSRFINIEEAKVTGIEDEFFKMVQLYPNPSQQKVVIEWHGHQFSTQLFNLQGQQLNASQVNGKISIDVSGYPKGLYALRLFANGLHKTYKLVVN